MGVQQIFWFLYNSMFNYGCMEIRWLQCRGIKTEYVCSTLQKGERIMVISKYIQHKLKVLNQLQIKITYDMKQELLACTNEIQVDNVARSFIMREE